MSAGKQKSKIARNYRIANAAAGGKDQKKLAAEYGITRRQVCNILNDSEIKKVVQESTNRLLQLMPDVVTIYQETLQDDDKKLRLDAARDITKISGAAPGNQSVFIQQIFNQSNVAVIHPSVSAAISAISAIPGNPANNDYIDI